MLNSMVADVISKSNQEQAEIEDIAEDDILNDILDDTTGNIAPVAAEQQNQRASVSDDDLLNDLLDDTSAQVKSEDSVVAENVANSSNEVDDLLGNLLAEKPQQLGVSAPASVSNTQQTQKIEEANNYDDLLGNLLEDDVASAKTEQEAAIKEEEEKFDSNQLLDNLISKVDESVLEDKPSSKATNDNIEETVTDQFVPIKQTMIHKNEVAKAVAVADDTYDEKSDDLLDSVVGKTSRDTTLSQITDQMDEVLEEPKKDVVEEHASPKAEPVTKDALQVKTKIEEGTKNGVKRSITELIENVKNQIICERETRTAQASSKTLEEVVGDLIQPKIVVFLNDNLERIVEDVVHREINKIIRGIDEEK